MHVMILGAAGMVGRKLANRLAGIGHIGRREITALSLVDVVAPQAPARSLPPITSATVDLTAPDTAERLVESRPDLIFHLAAIVVSGQAEADFTLGYRVNLDGTRALFEAVRHEGTLQAYCPRLIFASSIAVFGAPFPPAIGDEFFTTPLTSYGTQKAIDELLLADYTRRGFFDGIGLRLPTLCIRPGHPNQAASGFFSGILREPLNGEEAILPVGTDVRHWFASPRAAIGFLLHAAELDTKVLGARRNLTMPGLSATVAEEIDSLRRIAGEATAARIRAVPDATVAAIVAGWPERFDAARAENLGFRAETSFDAIIRAYIDEELGGKI